MACKQISFKEFLQWRLDLFHYENNLVKSCQLPDYQVDGPLQYLDKTSQYCLEIAQSNADVYDRSFSIFLATIIDDVDFLESVFGHKKIYTIDDCLEMNLAFYQALEEKRFLGQSQPTCLYNGLIRNGSKELENNFLDAVGNFFQGIPAASFKYSSVRDIYYSLANNHYFNFMTNRDIFNFARHLSYIKPLLIDDNCCEYRPEWFVRAIREFGLYPSYNQEKACKKIVNYWIGLDHLTNYTTDIELNDVYYLIDAWQKFVERPLRWSKSYEQPIERKRKIFLRPWVRYQANENLYTEIN